MSLNSGDRIKLGTAPDGSEDWYLEATFTPGHDRGHLVFQESRYGALIAGDMISTIATIMIWPRVSFRVDIACSKGPTSIFPRRSSSRSD